MIVLKGKSVFGGIEIGKLVFYKRNNRQVKRQHIVDTEAEVKRFREAQKAAVKELQELHEKAISDVGEENALIFEVHRMMLEDLDYLESIVHIISTQQVNAE